MKIGLLEVVNESESLVHVWEVWEILGKGESQEVLIHKDKDKGVTEGLEAVDHLVVLVDLILIVVID